MYQNDYAFDSGVVYRNYADMCEVGRVEEMLMSQGGTLRSFCAAYVGWLWSMVSLAVILFPDRHGIAATVILICGDSVCEVACAKSTWLSHCGR